MTPQETWDYAFDRLRETVNERTLYRWADKVLPDGAKRLTKPKKIDTCQSPKQDNSETVNIPTEYKVQEAHSEDEFGKGVVPEKVETVSCPATTDNEHDRLVARIQELEKMVSDLSFKQGNEIPPVPSAQQIIIVPHNMVVEIGKKRMNVASEGIMKLQLDNGIVVGVEVINNATQTQ
jgi:hypothetical protein